MDLYTTTSYELARVLTERYSTSFSGSSRLFARRIRPHIYAIYGMVRIADEIVDTYDGKDRGVQLRDLRAAIEKAIRTGYDSNPLIHAFATTATRYGIDASLIDPFFESMTMDITPQHYTNDLYRRYIYGSAEVVGLMCLRVFTDDEKLYARLSKGASALGAAYQKINFLRDMRADYEQLGRVYFPGVTFETFSDQQKARIIADIEKDLAVAAKAIPQLPDGCRKAVTTSMRYYAALLKKLRRASAKRVTEKRLRINNLHKALIFIKAGVTTR